MKKLKVCYIGNPDFAVTPLKYLVKNDVIEVSLVITQRDKKRSRGKLQPSPVKEFALSHQLDIFETDDINSKEAVDKIQETSPDFLVIVAFGQFIKKELLNLYHDRILNVHASILPKYRGASPINYALLNLDEKAGVTIMLVDSGMDTGDILRIDTIETRDFDYEELSNNLSEIGAEALCEVLLDFEKYYKNRTKQDNEKASYTGYITKDMGKVDFDDSKRVILGKSRSFSLWPEIYFTYKNENVKIKSLNFTDRIKGYENGQIIKVNNDGIFINVMDACLVVTKVQFPGKKSMSVKDYLLGHSIDLIKL